MRRGFTLIEVLIATVILGVGLSVILVSMTQSQNMMLGSKQIETVQAVMDLGDMAYPLENIQDPDRDIDIRETKATELWQKAVPNDFRLTSEQEEAFHNFTWERELIDKNMNDDDRERIGNIYSIRITVRWGDHFRGNGESESYVVLWRPKEEKGAAAK